MNVVKEKEVALLINQSPNICVTDHSWEACPRFLWHNISCSSTVCLHSSSPFKLCTSVFPFHSVHIYAVEKREKKERKSNR